MLVLSHIERQRSEQEFLIFLLQFVRLWPYITDRQRDRERQKDLTYSSPGVKQELDDGRTAGAGRYVKRSLATGLVLPVDLAPSIAMH